MTTQPMSVGDMAFLLERFAADCAPLQELRELTQNSIEAILRTPQKSGEVLWDVDWKLVAEQGVYKLSIIDSGDGMTGPDIERFINGLASSSGDQSLSGNFGVGAKITACTRNPQGVVYMSWRDGEGALAHLWLDRSIREYGLRRFDLEDGSSANSLPVSESAKPDIVESHGTKVVLLGRSDDHHTMVPPEGTPYPSHWITHYLNRRYFRFPEGIRVRVREFTNRTPDEWPSQPVGSATKGSQLREVKGMEHYLDRYSEASGEVPLTDATVYWWLFPSDPKLRKQTDWWQSSGHLASLYQDELYDMKTGQAGRRMLQLFGVLFGNSRVVLYIQPSSALGGRVTANTARSTLLLDREPLPWERWADEFRRQMPDEISAMMDELVTKTDSRDYRDAIKKRLKDVRDLFRFSRYRQASGGPVETGGSANGGIPRELGRTKNGKKPSGTEGGGVGDLLSAYLEAGGVPSKELKRTPDEPDARLISITDGTRDKGDLEDRAARYLPEQNLLLINADFRAFTDMIEHLLKDRDGVPGAPEVVKSVVYEWFEQQLIETVMGIQALKGSRQWDDDRIQAALGEEALTAAVMPRYAVFMQIKRHVGSELGALSKEAMA